MLPACIIWSALFQSAPPVETRGDHLGAFDSIEDAKFQSAPPVETRGDLNTCKKTYTRFMFQSAPPVETRGDTAWVQETLADYVVSIRSPRRNEGRRRSGCLRCSGCPRFNPLPPSKRGETVVRELFGDENLRFQSAPPVETRGDNGGCVGPRACSCFNPLPPSKRGETGLTATVNQLGEVSIRSPRRNEGRLPPLLVEPCIRAVSIRSPRRNEGRHEARNWGRQSVQVSIRSPRRNEGRHGIARCVHNRQLFQSAPPVETRGDWSPAVASLP